MKHFMRNLPCGMYRITSDNSIERLKDPKSAVSTKTFADKQENVSYKEMFPGSEEEERSLLSKYFYPIATLSKYKKVYIN